MAAATTRRRCATSAAAAGLLLVLVGCSSTEPPDERGTVIDVLAQDWRHVPGVAADGDGVRVTATGRRIVEQDGGGGRPDPALDLMGTHLVAEGDFTLRASFTDVTADATLTVADSPPVIADEFRIEPAGLRLTLRGDDLGIAVSDGSPPQDVTDPRPTSEEHVTVADPEAGFSVHRSGDLLEVASDGETVASLPLGDVFDSGDLWLGMSSEEGSFTVDALTATAPAGTPLSVAGPAAADAERSPDGLQALADRVRPGFRIGAAVALGPLAADPDTASAFVGEFGALTPENVMKPQALSPRQGEYTFQEADALLDLAEREDLAVHGHTIAFSEAMPRWMRELPADTEPERRASAEVLLDYVDTVVTHFRGRLDSLDVVNEPFDVDQGTDLQENTWYRVFGPSYPVVVSKAVHDADPDVRQFVNENGADVPGPRQDALRQLALDTNEQGGYIDGVGLQAHVYDLETDTVSAEDLTTTLDDFAEAGLLVRISENDVTDSEGADAQAEQYATVLGTCLRSDACVSWTTWGVDDRYDWFVDDDGGLQQGHDLLFDDGEPTPAYDAVRAVLAS
ncbi:endo-1,4-beta-xylanase [Curtobacterium sp. MCBD17_032]|uniref:endo-1,4-beta-xylanase n=1 Tax=Curtobacterium sp. MCBD17_032 TaxID=2175659 RepID=UPI000DAA9DFD|nr:endo-1,4-beta-xylanase [Curtobacterium sp. MCBD17_032]PZE86257.1 glycoside hydrolase [Curtobacterium sp. MCBD17_032]